MTASTTDESPFAEETVAAVAADHDLAPAELAALVSRHQSGVAALPGVENLAYEWRKRYADPLVARTEGAYYFAVPGTVWDEFGAHLDVEGDERAALEAVHERTTRERTDADVDSPAECAFVVLDRSATAE